MDKDKCCSPHTYKAVSFLISERHVEYVQCMCLGLDI